MAHTHQHTTPAASFNRAFALAVGLNLSFTAIEAVYAILANSMSLLADAGHNLGDVLGLILAWVANWLITKPASQRYSYGFKRTSIIAAIINALILVATSAIIAYESIIKLIYPTPVEELTVLIVALIGIFINGGTALLFLRGSKGDLNIKGAFLHLASDALISLGVVIAAALIMLTGWVMLDPITGLLIVVAILASTWGLLRDSLKLLLDAVPHGISHTQVTDYFAAINGVSEVHDLHIWGLSTKEVALTVHLIMPTTKLSDHDYQTITHDLKQQFNIDHITIQVEGGSDNHPCTTQKSCE